MKTFPQYLHQIYTESPDKPAIHLLYPRQPDLTMSYRDLIHGSAGYAHTLQAAGIQPGEVVILILQHSDDLVYSFFGVTLHGAIPAIMPFLTEKLLPEQYRRSLSALFEITAPAAVITYPEFENEVRQAIQPGSTVRAVLTTPNIPAVETVDFNKLRGFERQPEDIVLLQHSSGTTGLQKGVALSHKAVFNQLESYSDALQLRNDDVVVSWLPLYHDMGLIAGFILPILNRIPLVLMSPFDWVRAPYKLMQAVTHYHGTLSWLPNFAYNFCSQKIRARDLEGVDLSSWRAISNCSEPMIYKSHLMFLERFQPYGLRPEALTTCYAMAENVFAVTQGGVTSRVTIDHISQRGFLIDRIARPPLPGEPYMKMLSCGSPISNSQVKVVDDKYRDLPERQVGEIALQSDCMLAGYYRRDDLTAKAFHNGWYLTGDLGYMADGEVYVTGRKKDLIIVGGKNIYPQDLEALAGDIRGIHPGRVVAFGVFNEDLGTEEVIIVAETDVDERAQDLEARSQQLADEIRLRVTRGSDITVRYVKIVERGWLQKTSSGKVARSANREKYLAETVINS